MQKTDEWRAKLLHLCARNDARFNQDTAHICSRHFKDSCFKAGNSCIFVSSSVLIIGVVDVKDRKEEAIVEVVTMNRQQQATIVQQQQLIADFQRDLAIEQQITTAQAIENQITTAQATQLEKQADKINVMQNEVKSRSLGQQTTPFKTMSRPGRYKCCREMKRVLGKV